MRALLIGSLVAMSATFAAAVAAPPAAAECVSVASGKALYAHAPDKRRTGVTTATIYGRVDGKGARWAVTYIGVDPKTAPAAGGGVTVFVGAKDVRKAACPAATAGAGDSLVPILWADGTAAGQAAQAALSPLFARGREVMAGPSTLRCVTGASLFPGVAVEVCAGASPSAAKDPAKDPAKEKADAKAKDAQKALIGRMVSALKSGAECQDAASPNKLWCGAASGWDAAAFAPLPKGKLLVGLSVTLVDGGVVVTELRDQVALSVLALRTDGARTLAKLTAVVPSKDDADEGLMVAKATGAVTMVLKGKSSSAAMPDKLSRFFGTLPADAGYELAKSPSGQGWSWSGAASGELRKIGDVWVAIEPMATGVYVSVLTEKVK